MVRCLFEVRCAIWYHLYNLKNVKNTHGGVLILSKVALIRENTVSQPTSTFIFFVTNA